MPLEGQEGTTPIKPGWSRSSFSNVCPSLDNSGVAGKSLCEEDEASQNNILDMSSGGLEKLLSPDMTMLSFLNDSSSSSSKDTSLLLEKSGTSGSSGQEDSGISSLEPETEAEEVIVTAPKKDHIFSSDLSYKISIYSKVSGCRMTNLTEYRIVKQIRVAIVERLTNGDVKEALNYKFGFEKMANGGLQIISDSNQLIEMLGKLTYFAGIPCKMTFPDTPRVVGFVKGIPTDLEPSDLKDEIRKTFPEVYSVRYVTEKSRGMAHGMQRPCAFISFNLRFLPKAVPIFDEIFELQVPNPMQCTRCCRYGHQGKQCRAQTRCSFCGGTHQRQVCTAKIPSCINCLGVHTATSHDCLIWQQGKLMNELRYRGGMTAEEAISIASCGKVAQKKHCFTQADFFENQDSYFFGNENEREGEGGQGKSAEEKEKQDGEGSPQVAKLTPIHPRTALVYPWLDMITDLFLKVKDPNSGYTSADLMPGYDDRGFPLKKNRPISVAGKNFKESVQAVASKSPSYQNYGKWYGTGGFSSNASPKEKQL